MTSKGKFAYLAGIGVCLGLTALLRAIAVARAARLGMERPLSPMAFVTLALAFVLILIVYYKAWGRLQDGQARTTPGKAVGFCFIPLFNVYWLFVLFSGYAQDYNAYVQRHKLGLPAIGSAIFTVNAILWLLVFFFRRSAVLWITIPLVLTVVQLLSSAKVIETLKRLPTEPLKVAAETATPPEPPTTPSV
jgi:hypothetical protein